MASHIAVSMADEQPPSGKTLRLDIHSAAGGQLLGQVRWWAPWRRYTLHPQPDTVWDARCLNDVQQLLETLMHHHHYEDLKRLMPPAALAATLQQR